MKVKLIYIFCVVLVLVLGCAKPPLAEMESAREAVFRAEADPDAVLYAGGSISRAKDSLKRMQAEADSKRYDAAKTHAADAITAAEKAIADGKAAAVRAKSESEALVGGLRPAIEEAERNLNGARYSNLRLNYNELSRDLDTASDTVDQAETDFLEGKYQDAINKGRTARSIIGDVNEKISLASTSVSKKK